MDNNSQTALAKNSESEALYRRNLRRCFILFLIFFVYYMGTAMIQTQEFKSLAAWPAFGMPLGLLLSFGVFPVSWALVAVYFYLWR